MRIFIGAAAGAVVAVAAAGARADDEPGRYALQPDADGFVRLDTRTGAVSHCGQRDGVWYCEPFAEESAAVDARMNQLAAELASLRAQVEMLAARLDALTAKPDTAAEAAPPEALPEPVETRGFFERLKRRLFAMVRALKGAGGQED